MRLVFVNHAHPDIAHVSGMRFGYFAKEMAKRGHRVVVLVCALPGLQHGDPAGPGLSAELTQHDWAEPLVIAVPPRRHLSLDLIRQNRLPTPLRRALTLWQFIAHGGVFNDWQAAAMSAAVQLADEFRPDLVWGTFGNTTNLTLAQTIARRARCVWLMDIKDNWKVFIPPALRRRMARRFNDAAGWTSNSRHHQQVAARWLEQPRSEVIYSGVAEEFFQRRTQASAAEKRDLLMVGSIYDDNRLRVYLDVVRKWLEELPSTDRQSVRFVYVGSDTSRVFEALKASPLPCSTQVFGQLSIAELAVITCGAFANSYLVSAFTFHQKLLELLVCGRPVICFPVESEESIIIATQASARFVPCGTAGELHDALAVTWAQRNNLYQDVRVPAWRWSDFAEGLEHFFQDCLQERSV